jgi:hypothetical protein
MSFLKNPLQLKYLPVLICMLLGVAAFAITHGPMALVVMGVMAFFNIKTADQPLNGLYLHGYIALATITSSLAIYGLFVHVFALAITSGAVALLPLSIVFTRKGKA